MDLKHSTALALVVGLGLALPTSAQVAAQAAEADIDGNGFVTSEEAEAHDERRFETLVEGGGEMTLEQFRAGLLGAEVVGTEAEAEPMLDTEFGAADLDQNGTLSREEWLQWRQQRFQAAAGTEGQVETGLYVSIDAGGAMAGVDEGGEPLAEGVEPDTDPPAGEVNRVETDPDATTDPVTAPEADPAPTSDPAVEPNPDATTDPAVAPEADPAATSDPAVEPDPDATTDPAAAPETDPDATTDPAGTSPGGDPATEEGQTSAPLERPADGESATNESPADAEVSVWTGVYTEAQAERGKEVYSGLCSSCHGSRLDGAADDPDAQSAPPLARAKFLTKWNGSTLEGLFQYTKITMPVSNPGFLSDQEYVDVIAYMLASSNIPVGGTELPADSAALGGIILEEQGP